MPHIVFNDRTVAHQFRDDIDAELGFPKPGVRIGRGHTSLPGSGATTRYATVIKHPTLNLWAYPDDPIIIGKRSRVPLPGGATSQTLDATWDNAQPTSFRAPDPLE